MRDIKALLVDLRDELEEPLKQAEEAVHKEKAWLEHIYKGITGEDTISDSQVKLATAYTLGFLSANLQKVSGKVEP